MEREIGAGKRFEVAKFGLGSRRCIVVYEAGLNEVAPLIKKGLTEASKLLDTRNDIIINVYSTEDKFIKNKMNGINGRAYNTCALSLWINKNATQWKRFVISDVAHEFCHVVRFQRIGEKHWTLLDGMVQEGLAQCFAEQVTGRIQSWSNAITREQARAVWAKLSRKLNVEDSTLYYRAFLKRRDNEFPHWSGYTIGYLMIKARLRELGKDWNDVIGMKSKALKGKDFF